jgi:hypothetical protein
MKGRRYLKIGPLSRLSSAWKPVGSDAYLSIFPSTSARIRACMGKGVRRCTMDDTMLDLTIKTFMKEIRDRLDQAAAIGKAADACAEAGSCTKAVELSMDLEQLLYEATTLVNSASLLNRILR